MILSIVMFISSYSSVLTVLNSQIIHKTLNSHIIYIYCTLCFQIHQNLNSQSVFQKNILFATFHSRSSKSFLITAKSLIIASEKVLIFNISIPQQLSFKNIADIKLQINFVPCKMQNIKVLVQSRFFSSVLVSVIMPRLLRLHGTGFGTSVLVPNSRSRDWVQGI